MHIDIGISRSKKPSSVVIGSMSTQSTWSRREETSAELFIEVDHPTLGDLRALMNTFCNIEEGRIAAEVIVGTGSITGI